MFGQRWLDILIYQFPLKHGCMVHRCISNMDALSNRTTEQQDAYFNSLQHAAEQTICAMESSEVTPEMLDERERDVESVRRLIFYDFESSRTRIQVSSSILPISHWRCYGNWAPTPLVCWNRSSLGCATILGSLKGTAGSEHVRCQPDARGTRSRTVDLTSGEKKTRLDKLLYIRFNIHRGSSSLIFPV